MNTNILIDFAYSVSTILKYIFLVYVYKYMYILSVKNIILILTDFKN